MLADAGKPLPPNEISGRLIVGRSTVTGLVDSLERRGLVRRHGHPGDRRMLLVEITPQGRRAANRLRRLVHNHQREWLASLTGREQETLIGLLGRIQDHLAAIGN
jgi:DNA-binding MarR family transcriptional regulator